MKRRSRKEVSGSESGRNESASQSCERQPLAVKVSTPGIVGLLVPIIVPFAVLAILLAANLSLGEPRGDSRVPGTPVQLQSAETERLAE